MALVRARAPRQRVGVALLGAIDGSNAVFSFPDPVLYTPGGPAPAVYYNGQRLTDGDDYALSGGSGGVGWTTLTLLFAPRDGDKLVSDYATPA